MPRDKNKRLTEYVSYNYRFLYILGFKPGIERYFWMGHALLTLLAFLATGYFSDSFDKGAGQALFTFVFSLCVALGIFVAILSIQVKFDDEVLRQNPSLLKAIPDGTIVRIFLPADDTVIQHDPHNLVRPAGALEVVLNTIAVDKDEYFRVNAGALDIPKVALTGYDHDQKLLYTGICSFKDTFFSHQFIDFPLSRVSSGENDRPDGKTLRSLIGPAIGRHYATVNGSFRSYPGLPSPLGVTGATAMRCVENNSKAWLMQWRGESVSLDRNRFQMGYAGMVDAIPFFDKGVFQCSKFINVELYDEVFNKLFFTQPCWFPTRTEPVRRIISIEN